jgi:hypothetical protein
LRRRRKKRTIPHFISIFPTMAPTLSLQCATVPVRFTQNIWRQQYVLTC